MRLCSRLTATARPFDHFPVLLNFCSIGSIVGLPPDSETRQIKRDSETRLVVVAKDSAVMRSKAAKLRSHGLTVTRESSNGRVPKVSTESSSGKRSWRPGNNCCRTRRNSKATHS